MYTDYAYCQSDLAAAQRVALDYMTALFRGDIEKAAKLTHPDTLATLKRTFLVNLDQARAAGRQNELLKKIGIRVDVGTLRGMNPHDLYVTILKSNQKRGNTAAFKEMNRTTVEVVGGELFTADEAAVRLKIKIPADDGFDSRDMGLLLSRYNKYWRIKTNLE